MAKLAPDHSQTAGLPPGTLVHVGKTRAKKVRITVIDYSETDLQEKEVAQPGECAAFRDTATVTWINVDGVHDIELIRTLGEQFDLHPLLLEDIANTRQRPKVEEYGSYLFIVVKMLYIDEQTGGIDAEQVSLVLGPNFVLSFQEQEGDVFETIRERIRTGKGRIRSTGADYLAYSLIDAIVDNYFVILEGVGERIESLEDALVADPTPGVLGPVRDLRREALFLRRAVWPLREVLNSLSRGGVAPIQPDTLPYLRDLYDHTIQVIDTVENFRDLIAGMRETHLSAVSNRMNEVMKVLTIIATIFIPLTFIAGVYGMNFDRMPELKWAWGYPVVLGVMALVAAGMVLYFKRKKWL